MIILDIINNNITFVLPTVHKEAMIHVKQFTGETFRHMYNMGKFNDIDYLMSNFKDIKFIIDINIKADIEKNQFI